MSSPLRRAGIGLFSCLCILSLQLVISFQYLGMLITKVKVGQVTNLSEARYCAGMGVDFLSFPISSIDPKTYQEITGWVAGPKFGVEIDNSSPSLINEYKTDFIVVPVDRIDSFLEFQNLIVSLEAGQWPMKKTNLLLAKGRILYLELTISSLDELVLGIIHEITEDFKILLKPSGSIDTDKLVKMPVDGLSFDGNAETKPGLKEYPLSEILEKLEAEGG
jgi:phosphoribosylanthranilate isomerase